ncbi:galactose oxidase [Aestuariibacter halophilus]|uniref:Galactose oxidase n=1 Tax=Fluctibacter halophilus TaxID=226011 RepID=A0ABS8GB13_9ALTE|nr:galactose oxidase [Aestuariibacter halophilus]MCC2617366.1 galactose oxidase [Aestuariibacter halophilus]
MRIAVVALGLCWSLQALAQHIVPPLPEPVTNNALAMVEVRGAVQLYSFMGLARGKGYGDVHHRAWRWASGNRAWQPIKDVPTRHYPRGRLASVAAGVGRSVYLFGGYSVDVDGHEVSSPENFVFDTVTQQYAQVPAMPVAVDDAIALVYQQRYIYLVSGWHNDGNVNLVQMLDTRNLTWHQASPLPNRAVFGHAGGIVGNKMVVCDGVKVQPVVKGRRTFLPAPGCLLGDIDVDDPRRINWRLLAHPTGIARYRMAAAGSPRYGQVFFFGGSTTAYNFNGIGYNGSPALPDNALWALDMDKEHWRVVKTQQRSMDHRGMAIIGDQLVIPGGMDRHQQVRRDVTQLDLTALGFSPRHNQQDKQ